MAARDFGPWQYTSDNARVFVRRADKFLTDQEAVADTPNVGGTSAAALAAASYETMPANWRPRMVIMGSAGLPSRSVVVYSTAAPLWTSTPPTMSLRDAGGVAATYTVQRRVGERQGRLIGRGQ